MNGYRKHARVRTLATGPRSIDQRAAPPMPKGTDPHYGTADHRRWAAEVIRRAGGCCQAPGCTRAAPAHRLYADHVVELQDGGDPLDPANGRCLCAPHHATKTAATRTARLARPTRRGMGGADL